MILDNVSREVGTQLAQLTYCMMNPIRIYTVLGLGAEMWVDEGFVAGFVKRLDTVLGLGAELWNDEGLSVKHLNTVALPECSDIV